MKWKLLPLLLLLIIPLAVAVPESVTRDLYTITSPSDIYYCQPIFRGDSCLIKSQIEITNNNAIASDLTYKVETSEQVEVRNFQDKSKSIGLSRDKGQRFNSGTVNLRAGATTTIDLNFYASKSGKFNFSIFYGGKELKLDPIFNVTHNASVPSLHLINTTSNLVPDGSYSSTSEIASDLSDGLDATNFETNEPSAIPINGSLIGFWKFDEGSGINCTDSSARGLHGNITGATYISSKGGNGTGTSALRFDGDDDFCKIGDPMQNVTVPFTVSLWTNKSDAGLNNFFIYKNIVGTDTNFGLEVDADEKVTVFHRVMGESTRSVRTIEALTLGTWVHIIAVVNGSGSQDAFIYMNGTQRATESGSSTGVDALDQDLYFGVDANLDDDFLGDIDEIAVFNRSFTELEILGIFNNGVEVETTPQADGKAIKANFNITLNSDNDYFLQTRKTTSGLANITIFNYLNDSDINTSDFVTYIISTGDDVVPLTSLGLINNNSNATFRLFTQALHNFSELTLIESINDTINPIIQNCAVNNTVLTCGDAIFLSCNVTDDNLIDKVFFQWNDTIANDEEVDKILNTDIYFKNKTYGQNTNGTPEIYTFIQANASDLVQNSVVETINLDYSYTCLIDEILPIVTLDSPANNSFTNVTDQTLQCSATDNIQLSNLSLFHNASGIFTLNETAQASGTAQTSFFNKTFETNTTLLWNCQAFDTIGNFSFAPDNFTLNFNQTFPAPIIPAVGLFLQSPENNTLFNSTISPISIEFVYFINFTETTNVFLFINGTFNQSQFSVFGNNTFSSVAFAQNNSYEWFVNTSVNDTNFQSGTFFFTTNIIRKSTQFLSLTECPNTTAGILVLWLLVFIAAIFIVLGLNFQIGFIGFFGALMLMVTSWFISPCVNFFALLLAFFAIVMIVYFAFVAPLGFRNRVFD